MNMTLKDVPDSLHQRLREAAAESGRSLNKLVLHTLEQAFCPQKSDRIALLERIRNRRRDMKMNVDSHSLANAIENGRS